MADAATPSERTMYEAHPAMFRARPFLFLLFCLLAPALIGIILILIWWFRNSATTLTVTTRFTRLQKGIFSRDLREVRNWDVRYVEIRQGFLHRLLKVGAIRVLTAADPGAEITVKGIPNPMEVKDLIEAGRPTVQP